MRMGAGKMAMTTLMKLTTYIYYNAVFVCHEKSSLSPSQLSAGGAKRDGRQALPAVGRLWPSDVDGDS